MHLPENGLGSGRAEETGKPVAMARVEAINVLCVRVV
jgi:hypothetical protein